MYERKANKDISGHGWSKQADSAYFELYINGDEYVFNDESYGPIPRKYEYHLDSIYIYNFENEKLVAWRIIDSSGSILITANQERKHTFHRLNLPKSYFESYWDTLAWENFEEDFIKRTL